MAATFTDEGMKLLWLTSAFTPTGASLAALKVQDFTPGANVIDLSDFAIVGGCEFVEADPDTIDQKVYSDKGKVTVPTLGNYTGKGQFRRDRSAGGALSATDVKALFDSRQRGYIIKRLGVPEGAAVAAGQDYEYFRFIATRVSTINDADGGYETIEVGFLQDGDHGFGIAVANS